MVKSLKDLSAQDLEEISGAVAEAESRTSGEIIPVLSWKAGEYGASESAFAFLVSLAGLAAVWLAFQGVAPGSDWSDVPRMKLGLPALLGVSLVSYVAGLLLARRFPKFVRPFISKRTMAYRVEQRAALAFNQLHLTDTRAGTGVLIFVARYEHHVVVMGDGPISEKLQPEDWKNLRDVILNEFRHSRYKEGFLKGIREAGLLLERHFPRDPADPNELPNVLRVI